MALSGSWAGRGAKGLLAGRQSEGQGLLAQMKINGLDFLQLGSMEGLRGLRLGKGTGRRQVWHRALESTQYGQFSLAMYEANYVMEDTVEVRGWLGWEGVRFVGSNSLVVG